MKRKNIFIFVLVLVAAFAFMFIYARPSKNVKNTNTIIPKEDLLSVDKTLHDFGTISMKDGNVKTTFKINNDTAEDILLNKLYTSCMCTEAKLIIGSETEGPFGMLGHGFTPTFKQILKAREEAEIEVQFDPNAHGPSGVGVIERTVTLEGKDGNLLSVNIKANVTP